MTLHYSCYLVGGPLGFILMTSLRRYFFALGTVVVLPRGTGHPMSNRPSASGVFCSSVGNASLSLYLVSAGRFCCHSGLLALLHAHQSAFPLSSHNLCLPGLEFCFPPPLLLGVRTRQLGRPPHLALWVVLSSGSGRVWLLDPLCLVDTS